MLSPVILSVWFASVEARSDMDRVGSSQRGYPVVEPSMIPKVSSLRTVSGSDHMLITFKARIPSITLLFVAGGRFVARIPFNVL